MVYEEILNQAKKSAINPKKLNWVSDIYHSLYNGKKTQNKQEYNKSPKYLVYIAEEGKKLVLYFGKCKMLCSTIIM